MKWSFKIGSILGIPLKVHVTFLLLLLIIYFAGGSIIGIGGMHGLIFVVLIFASVVFHEARAMPWSRAITESMFWT